MQIATVLYQFVEQEVLPDLGLSPQGFWQGCETIFSDFITQNKALLETRERLQSSLDNYCHHQAPLKPEAYQQYLTEIGYLQPEPDDFHIATENVDAEIAQMAGPQLVVPINNARYALNAANARWGSLYDALYGTDAISEADGAEKTKAYNPVRGQKVIAFAKQWLDTVLPLEGRKHEDVTAYRIVDGALRAEIADDGVLVPLHSPAQFKGLQGDAAEPQALLCSHNGLHFEIQLDAQHPIGQADSANVKDILLESALTTIMDCEDSVAAVDAEDKVEVYRNWLGLMKGTLQTTLSKGTKQVTRKLNADRSYTTPHGKALTLPGRSLMFVRNVGLLMNNDAILFDDEAVPEGIMDALLTSTIALYDLNSLGQYHNSLKGSIYIVKPKMHGPEEVAFSDALFARVESMLGLEPNTIKMGVMDEERRTSVNLKACIHAARKRVAFINTGFLDRTGDEIHTSMHLGPFAPKAELKQRAWIKAYERANVSIGLQSGMSGKAQIGKGMWPIPDNMADMLEQKIGHPQAGANTAWVPSPTAATLHALHYHQINVSQRQQALSSEAYRGLDDLLEVPLLGNQALTTEQIQRELDNNVQGILGYVVRWVNQGIGCSKVPDINNVGLMEDRATLRISSQHIANWLRHGLVNEADVKDCLTRMASLVDEQNADDPDYIPMSNDLANSIAFDAACRLIFEGKSQPSGYTEPLLHEARRAMKEQLANEQVAKSA